MFEGMAKWWQGLKDTKTSLLSFLSFYNFRSMFNFAKQNGWQLELTARKLHYCHMAYYTRVWWGNRTAKFSKLKGTKNWMKICNTSRKSTQRLYLCHCRSHMISWSVIMMIICLFLLYKLIFNPITFLLLLVL